MNLGFFTESRYHTMGHRLHWGTRTRGHTAAYAARKAENITALGMARTALREVRRSRPRWKSNVVLNAYAPVTAVWVQQNMVEIAQGDDLPQREGSHIHIHAMNMLFDCETAAALGSAATIRLVLVYDKNTNGALFSPNDLFITSNVIQGMFDRDFVGARYRVLWDHTFSMQEFSANASVTARKILRKDIRFRRPLSISYSGTGATIADIVSGAIQLMAITSSTDNQPTITFQVEIRFTSTQN